jgi:hypothetical protein
MQDKGCGKALVGIQGWGNIKCNGIPDDDDDV